jgi:ferredoxin
LDLILTEIDDGYAVQAITDKGGRLARQMPGQDQTVDLPEPVLLSDVPRLQPSDTWRSAFNEVLWRQLGERCLGCRTCTFVCPTCRCFDVRDEVRSSRLGARRIERLRAWDACTMANYRRIAGGHNPRGSQEVRLQNRFYCKFSYYPDDFGPLGCVGCGRCVDACPVGVDIREAMSEVDRIASVAEQ